MKWLNVTCDNSKHIVEVQKWLFNKYVGIEPMYLDVKDTPIDKWGLTVADMLPDDEYCIFGLDDFLPIDFIKIGIQRTYNIMIERGYERFELGIGARHKVGMIENNGVLEYGKDTPYKVSCQFSIWKTEALFRELVNCTTPWQFEIKGTSIAACYPNGIFNYIEESAISGRQKDKINLCGLRLEDENELIKLGLINKNNIIYGWKGNNQRTKDSFGTKYAAYY